MVSSIRLIDWEQPYNKRSQLLQDDFPDTYWRPRDIDFPKLFLPIGTEQDKEYPKYHYQDLIIKHPQEYMNIC